MPATMDFSFKFGGSPPAAKRRDPGAPLRILLIGDFSARPAAERPPLAERPIVRVDVDTLDTVLARLAPRLLLDAGELAFAALDDFHPDALHARLPLFRRLQEACAEPAADLLGGLLGRSAAAADSAGRAARSGLGAFIEQVVAPHIVADTSGSEQGRRLAVDAAATEAMRAILHAPAFRQLEAAWRGVQWLVGRLPLDERLQLHLLDASRDELLADLAASGGRVAETGLQRLLAGGDRSAAGAAGWNLLVGLQTFGPGDVDIGLLAGLGLIAAQVGAPFVAAGDPALAAATAGGWPALRRSEVAPWLGLVAPRLLLRQPYGRGRDPVSAFAFEELGGSAPLHDRFLWAPGSLAVALLVGRAFGEDGWDFDPGNDRDIDDLPAVTLQVDGEHRLLPCAEALLDTPTAGAWLAAGLMPLQSHRGRNAATLLRLQSIAEPAAALAGLQIASA